MLGDGFAVLSCIVLFSVAFGIIYSLNTTVSFVVLGIASFYTIKELIKQ